MRARRPRTQKLILRASIPPVGHPTLIPTFSLRLGRGGSTGEACDETNAGIKACSPTLEPTKPLSQFRNLAFEGGGVKGIAYAGALKRLEAEGVLQGVRRAAGTSAGAVTATLLALGARGEELLRLAGATPYHAFLDDSAGLLRDGWRLMKKYGWHKGDAFTQWMGARIAELAGRQDITFRELAARARSEPGRFLDLHVIGTHLSEQRARVYSAEQTPDFPILRAVRISMSIPLFFTAVSLEDGLHVDGGVIWNYPIDLFDEPRLLADARAGCVPPDCGAGRCYNRETLGLRVDTSDDPRRPGPRPRLPLENLSDYLKATVNLLADLANKVHLSPYDWQRTVYIDTGTVRATDFHLKPEQVQELLRRGDEAVASYLAWFRDPGERPLNRIEPA